VADGEPEKTLEELEAAFSRARVKLGTDAKSRGVSEGSEKKRAKHRVLTKTWRSERDIFCCTSELKKRISTEVKKSGLSKAEWMETAILAWIERDGEKQ